MSVNECLEVRLHPSDVEKYPEFTKLLHSISKHITSSSITKQIEKELVQAKENLRREKHPWLLNELLYTELKELILDYRIKSQDISLCSEDKKYLEILQKCLKLKEIGDYLDFSPDPSIKATTLGLTGEDIDRLNPYKKHISSVQVRLVPEIKERLYKKLEELVHYEDPSLCNSDNPQLNMAKSSQLPAMIETLKKKLRNEERLLKQDRTKREKQFWIYYQSLVDSLSLLEKLITDYRLQGQTENDTITTNWLKQRCDGIALKFRLCQLQVLCETYTTETVKALRQIKNNLDDALDEGNKDLGKITEALKAYDSLGQEFEGIVEEYTKLRSDLENKRWAMTQLLDNKSR